ncbi:unnamed protein product [Rotaria sordida]|uniref:Cupin-like domain-containing protein n=1 Tax=Rotaria sordida TaxID=392033 RepID=A0A813ULH1_9BILA|nr:unnamed protein product [Rotaria sordida]
MNSKKEDNMDILNNINNQFKELIELIEKEKDSSFSIKYFDKLKKTKKKKKSSKKKWLIISSFILILISIYFILLNEELTYNIYFVLLSFIRLILIKILPYWDWTNIYTRYTRIRGQKCANTTQIIKQSNITFFNFTKNIYLNNLPVIVDDATETWPAMKELTVKKLFQLFMEDPILAENDICYFESNIRNYNRPGGVDQLFNDYIDGNRRSFMVQWNNCKRETLKVIRSYYNKPYFLPPSVAQTLMGNWFLVSAGFHKGFNYLHKVPLNYDWIWLAQIQGSSLIELRPKHPCEKICSILKSVTLNKGDLSNNCFLFVFSKDLVG